MRTVYLYGIGGAIDDFRVIRCVDIDRDSISIMTFKHEALQLRAIYPAIKRVFAGDNNYDVYRSYMEAKRRPTVDNNLAFVDLLEKQGIEIN